MRVELVGFSQGVSLSNTEETINYLDFKKDTGHQFRIPISQEAMSQLLQEIYEQRELTDEEADEAEDSVLGVTGTPSQIVPNHPPEATVFGDEESDEPDGIYIPESEDEVPSL